MSYRGIGSKGTVSISLNFCGIAGLVEVGGEEDGEKNFWSVMAVGSIMDMLFPPLCLNCRKNERVRFGLCAQCLAEVEFTGLRACIRCGRICGNRGCAPLEHRYSRVLSMAHYIGPWRKVVQAVKFARDRSVAVELAQELARLALEAGLARPQAIVPAPSASKHWRNFAVVDLICRELSGKTGAPVVDALARRPGRPAQVLLNRSQRTLGLEDYLYVIDDAKVQDALIWLVDDVYTTGATADACTGVLLSAGARQVYVLVLGA